MPIAQRPIIKYGEKAEEFETMLLRKDNTQVIGAICRNCESCYLTKDALHLASYCCATTRPCETDGCDGMTSERYYKQCDSCLAKIARDKYEAREAIAFGPDMMIVENENFFSDESGWIEYMYENQVQVENARPMVARKMNRPTMDLYEYCGDYFGPDFDSSADFKEIDAIVNKWIDENVEQMWTEGKQRLLFDAAEIQKEIDRDV